MNLLRNIFAVCSILILFGILGYAWCNWEGISVLKDVAFNELIKAGIQLKIDQSRAEFQLSLLVIATLWALIVAKKDEAQLLLSDVPECLMFCTANLLLLISIWFHILYIENVTYIYSLAGGLEGEKTIPDILNSGINNPYNFQFWTLSGGILVAALTFLSAHKLK